MAGTINLALTQQFDMDGKPLSGGRLDFFTAATTNPQSAFQDTGLTIPWPNPIVLDASGRIPMFYLADGNIKIRLSTKTGVTVIAADNLLVIGPSSGGSGGGGVDATTVMATGDIKARFSTGTLGGFVRCNGGTIGSLGAAGVTERGNADCQALFEYLWSTTVLQVFSGTTANRGTTANGDWAANKVIALPDLRGRTIAGMDDLGLGAAGRLTSAGLGVAATTLGNAGGAEAIVLATAQLPSHTHQTLSQHFGGSLSIGADDADHAHNQQGTITTAGINSSLDHTHVQDNHNAIGGVSGGGGAVNDTGLDGVRNTGTSSLGIMDHSHNATLSGQTSGRTATHAHAVSGTTQPSGSGTAHQNVQPAMVLSFYIKL